MTFIGTFGVNQPLGKHFVRIAGKDYAEVRQKMMDTYGTKWAFLYQTEDGAGVNRFKLTEVPFGTPNTEAESRS